MIYFCVVGWHYNQKEYYQGLKWMDENNPEMEVFWNCRKDPPKYIKDNFDWKLFSNDGLEWGAYQQVVDHLDFEDDDIIFFTHDDIIIKDWGFVNLCVQQIGDSFDVIGNGRNYGFYLDPDAIITPGNENEYRPFAAIKTWKEVAINKEFYENPMQCMTVRGSFVCMNGKSIKEVNGFEWFSDPYDGKNPDLQWGNIMVNLNGYKFTKTFGQDRIAYMSTEYAESDFISELARGGEK
jgi:hypothetical protein